MRRLRNVKAMNNGRSASVCPSEVPLFPSEVFPVVYCDERNIEKNLFRFLRSHLVRNPVLFDIAFIPVKSFELR